MTGSTNLTKFLAMSMSMLCMVCTVAAGKTIYVDDDGPADFNSIQAAIDDANDVDEVIVSPGVYNENINFGGKNIVLRSTNPDSPKVVANTVIDGGFKGHTVTFAGTETPDCILSGFTITRGRNTYWCDGLGGGIFGNGTFSTIEHNLIYNNKALPVCGPADGLGGGIYNCDGLIQDNMIFGNVARGDEFLSAGGGLYGCDGTIRNNVIAGNSAWLRGGGLFKCNGEIINCTVCYNRNGGIDMCSGPIRNCILWANVDDLRDANAVFSCIEDNDVGQGNIHHDPCFVDTGYWDPHETPGDPYDDFWINGDYHLKSQAGRWDEKEGRWTKDDVTSPCIDAGDPLSPIGEEPFPNGGRINMGAYGGTAEGSKSYFGGPVCETVIAGDINGDCRVDFSDLALMAAHWLQDRSRRGATTTYKFLPDQSTMIWHVGRAGWSIPHSIEGQFQLTVDFDAGVARFEQVSAVLTNGQPPPTHPDVNLNGKSLGDLFLMCQLVGTIVSDTAVHFEGHFDFDESDESLERIVVVEVSFRDNSVYLTGTSKFSKVVPDASAYSLDAVAVVVTEP